MPSSAPSASARVRPRTSDTHVEGSKVDIGGRNLYIDCRGEGSPTVILEGGLTSDTTAWNDVIDPIAGFTRVCAYGHCVQCDKPQVVIGAVRQVVQAA
jgi:hypothetical protein